MAYPFYDLSSYDLSSYDKEILRRRRHFGSSHCCRPSRVRRRARSCGNRNCFCEYRCSPEVPAPPIQEEPLEERLRTLVNLSEVDISIKKGDRVDLEQLLFTPKRDYLMKYNGEKVPKDGLSNKYVLLYMFPLDLDNTIHLKTRELRELRELLWDTGAFEIVFVGFDVPVGEAYNKELESPYHYVSRRPRSANRDYFARYAREMTWPFIPFEDRDAKEYVRSTFGFSTEKNQNYTYFGIVDPTGKLLQSWAWDLLNYYGHDAFPFTDEKIFSLYREEASIFTEGLSLRALLGSSNRDYVLSPKGDKVPIQDLEDKVVCIILDDPVGNPKRNLVRSSLAYAQLDDEPDLVVVYVCRHFTSTIDQFKYFGSPDKAKEIYESVDWHKIPYGDPSVRKIWRVILRRFKPDLYYHATACNIVGPHGRYINSYALSCMRNHEFVAYPFNLEHVAELESRKLRREFSFPRFLRETYGRETSPPWESRRHLAVKHGGRNPEEYSRLLILFGTVNCFDRGEFLRKLESLYFKTPHGFEVLYIACDCIRSTFDDGYSYFLPWTVFPYLHKKVVDRMRPGRKNFRWCGGLPAIAAYSDGVLVGWEGDLHLKREEPMEFPFVNTLEEYFIKKYSPTEGDLHLKREEPVVFPFVNTLEEDFIKKCSPTEFPSDYEFWRMF